MVEYVDELCSKAEPYEVCLIRREVAAFTIWREARQYKKQLKPLQPEMYEFMTNEVRSKLYYENTYQRLWRAMFFKVKTDCDWEASAAKFNVASQDLELCWTWLGPAGQARVKAEATASILLDPLPADVWETASVALLKHAKRIVRKLLFTVKHDPGHTLDDKVSELLMRGMATMRNYEYLAKEVDGQLVHDVPKIINHARRGMSNYLVDRIKYHTHGSRARIVNMGTADTVQCWNCESTIQPGKDKCPQCGGYRQSLNAVQEYQATTLSLDVAVVGATASNLHTVLASEVLPTDYASQQISFKEFLTRQLHPNELQFAQILMDNPPAEFCHYLRIGFHLEVEELSPKSLKWHAANWLGLNNKRTVGKIKRLLSLDIQRRTA